jgi:hypothetical protein
VAYRAGEKITDTRTGEVHDYSRRRGVVYSELLLPDGTTTDREAFWNALEATEKRRDAVVAKEIVLALPHELKPAEQIALTRAYVLDLAERTGWAVDMAIHTPSKDGDERNVHAHLMCSTRGVSRGSEGEIVFGLKTRAWDVKPTGPELVRAERAHWAEAVNQALERAGQTVRVDHRSHVERGTGLLATLHLGPDATQLERQGVRTEAGDYNREVIRHNAQVVQLSDVREQRQERQTIERELKRLEALPLAQHRSEVSRLAPSTVDALIWHHPQVWPETRKLQEPENGRYDPKTHGKQFPLYRDCQARGQYLKGRCESLRQDLAKLEAREKRDRQKYKLEALLHDWKLPFCKQPDFTYYAEQRAALKEAIAKADTKHTNWEIRRDATLTRAQWLAKQVRPEVEKQHAQKSRLYAEAKGALEARVQKVEAEQRQQEKELAQYKAMLAKLTPEEREQVKTKFVAVCTRQGLDKAATQKLIQERFGREDKGRGREIERDDLSWGR